MKINRDMKQSHGMSAPHEIPDEHYPSFYVTGDEPLDIPHEGEMVIKYKKVSSSQSEGPSGEHYSCTIDVKEIVSVEGKESKAPSKRDRSAEENLDRLMKEKEKKGY